MARMQRGLAGLFVAVFLCLISAVSSSHFRGAMISWKPANASDITDKTVTIITRIAWRRSYSGCGCDQNTIASGNLIGPSGSLTCRFGCSGSVGSMRFKCTDYSEQEDWTSGQTIYDYTFPSSTNPPLFQASFAGGDWISLVTGGGSWEVRAYFNLTKRNDTGVVNSSPNTAMSPIVQLKHGCNHTIAIPVSDADKDEVRCRWAESSKGECAGVCHAFRGAILDTRKCTISYSATGALGWYAAALMIEDFSSPLSRLPLSSVPLQFLVKVFRSSEKCHRKPEFVDETRADRSCIGVPFNMQYTEPVIARSGGETSSISEITTISPQGLTKSSLGQRSPREWYVNITWTPSQSQLGPNIFCYTAIDSSGLTSSQRCITLLGGVTPPRKVDGSQSPTGLIYANHARWVIHFDQQFVRPSSSRFIRVWSSDGIEVYKLDVAITNTVIYPAGSVGRELEFTLPYSFQEKQTYSITLDPGVAKGATYCGAESPAIRDHQFWRVTIRDVTAPSITFLSRPSLTNANITITWQESEEATAVCTIIAPDHAYVSPCNHTWTGLGLQEGNYRISIMATDQAGNTAPPVIHSWRVDKTPPTPYISHKPPNVTQSSSATFAFRCTDKDWYNPSCSYECDVKPQGSQPSGYAPCPGEFTVDRLVDNTVYVLWIKSRDQAGNLAAVLTYTWRIDRSPPVLSILNTLTVPCTSNLDPSRIGQPTVRDNVDPSPSLTYSDQPLSSNCGVLRTWSATDRAGNKARGVQEIRISNPTAPILTYNRSIMVACETLVGIAQDLSKEISASHPCGMPVNMTHTDSIPTMQCDVTFTRYWTIRDPCGYNLTVPQTVKVLGIQPPDYPKSGQVNVDLNQELSWPQYPGAVQYKIFIWKYQTPQPSTPTATTRLRGYSPGRRYPHGTKMLWKVEYMTSSGAKIPGPVWGFVTRHYNDFKVQIVTVPLGAFSGQSLSVSWTVRNIGGHSNAVFAWYDVVYISKTTEFSDARVFTRKWQQRILESGDGYTDTVTGVLGDSEIGVYYAFVKTYSASDDIDPSNNWRISSGSVRVALTPPPNLKVDSVAIPPTSFSGRSITVTWTVSNQGLGNANVNHWYDRVVLSRDHLIDSGDKTLGDFIIRGPLFAGLTYRQSKTVRVPDATYGNFSIIVTTDVFNNVFEYTAESDNDRASQALKVILSPPPDLVVSEISTNGTFKTGNTVSVSYRVTNRGYGPPFETYWQDEMALSNKETRQREVLGKRYFSGVLSSQGSYTRVIEYTIPPRLKSGNYELSVHTDNHNNVFEFTFDNNNIMKTSITIMDAFPDLAVKKLSVNVERDETSAFVRVNFTVENRGDGKTFGAPWTDGIFVSATLSLTGSVSIGRIPRGDNLSPSRSYEVIDSVFRIPRNIHGRRYILIYTDSYQSVTEAKRNNNYHHSSEVFVPQVLPDLIIQDVRISVRPDETFADELLKITWVVVNTGVGSTLDGVWVDAVYLTKSESAQPGDIKLHEEPISSLVPPGKNYSKSATFTVPMVTGQWYIIVKTNDKHELAEDDLTNNVRNIRVRVSLPSRPDLMVLGVSYVYRESVRLLRVHWLVRNDAFSMRERESWWDKVLLSPSPSRLDVSGVIALGTKSMETMLYSQQDYGAAMAFTLPKELTGTYYVHVKVNFDGKLKEKLRGMRENDGASSIALDLSRAPSPKLEVKIISQDSNITLGKRFTLEFEVLNVGYVDAPKDSWIDAVYIYNTPGAESHDVIGSGTRLAQVTHTGGLAVGGQYRVTADIEVPYTAGSPVYFYAYTDIYNRMGSPGVAGASSKPVQTRKDRLANLIGSFNAAILTTRGGQPFNISYNVTNKGEGATNVRFFNALYLSEDTLLDPFDLKLGSFQTPSKLSSDSSVTVTQSVFIPFDTLRGQYYTLLAVDSDDRVYEEDEGDNLAFVLTEVESAPSTDLLVSEVMTAPSALGMGSDLEVNWRLRNNGSRQAQGYKCDTVYLSQDETWQIEDTAVGRPKCDWVSLSPYNGGATGDASYSIKSPLSIVAPGTYRGLVKSRSNIRDMFPDNNIKTGPSNLNISYPTLELGKCQMVTSLKEVFVVPDVPVDETLIVTSSAKNNETTQFIYLRHGKPATSNAHDAGPRLTLSAYQEAVVESTRAGDYFVLLRKSDVSGQAVHATVCAKIAKFEISRVLPGRVAPFGVSTLQVQGSLFAWKSEAYLCGSNTTLKALEIYRSSSSVVFITFNFTGIDVGHVFSLRLIDVYTSKSAYLNDSLTIVNGIPGKISMVLNSPRAFRAGEEGFITLNYQNVGDTDIVSPTSLFTVDGGTEGRLLQEGTIPGEYSQIILFLAQPLEGPAGILPPRAYGQVTFRVRQIKGSPATGQSSLNVDYVISSSEPHMFLNSSDDFRPGHLPEWAWAPVWRNFLSSVGKTQRSLNERLGSAATAMSVLGRRIVSVDELVRFQVNLANGKQYGSPLLDTVDLSDTGSRGSLVLRLERTYSPALTKRRVTGVFGAGWIAPWWEISVAEMAESAVRILMSRDEILFTRQESSAMFLSGDNQRVFVESQAIIFYGESETYVFDASTKRLKEIRPYGHAQNCSITVTSYTPSGLPRELQYSEGGELTVEFSDRGLIREAVLVKATGESVISLYEYDPDVPLLLSVTTNHMTTRYTYNALRDISSVTYPNAARLRYIYNEYELLGGIQSFASDGSIFKDVEFMSDWNGVIITTDKMKGTSVTMQFDERVKPVSLAGPDGIPARTQTLVTEEEITRKTINGDQVIQTQIYNIPDHKMTTEDANGNTMSYVFNEDGIPLNVTDPAGNGYSYEYNNQSKVIESRLPDGSKENSEYDDGGKLVKRTTRKGRVIKFEYGADGRVSKKEIPDVGVTYYLHDSRGNLIMATNKHGTVSIEYNKNNRPVSVKYPDGRLIEYRYNRMGRRIGISENSTGYNVTYRYDQFNRLSEVWSNGEVLMRMEHNSTGSNERRVFGNGMETVEEFLTGTRTLKSMHNKAGALDCSKFEYEYNSKGRPVKIKTLEGSREFKYDAMSQLVAWRDSGEGGNGSEYSYDSRKNRYQEKNLLTGEKDYYESNVVNQYTSAGEFVYEFDKNGNMVGKKSKKTRTKDVKFVFSEDNVLMQTETANERCNYLYDALGLLYKKSCISGDTRYIVDPFGVYGVSTIGQISGGNVTHFVHAEEKGLISLIKDEIVYYYQFNGEGSVISLVKDDCQTPINTYQYDPFGQLLSVRESVRNDFLFIGQWGVMRDKEVPGLYRMRARHYDSQIGRFISFDPLGDASLETNFYVYANNNPIMLQDPNGRIAVLIVAGGALLGSVTSVVSYGLGTLATGDDFTLGGAVGAAVSGGITGAATTAAAALGPFAAYYFGSRTAMLANGAGYAIQTAIDGTEFKGNDFMTNMATGFVFGGLPIKIPGLSKLGGPSIAKDFANGVFGGLVSGLTPNFQKVWKQMKNLAKDLSKGLGNLYKMMKKGLSEFLDWIRSHDPNDIIGPAGIGDAHYIRGDLVLDYKIRYENHPNASAPAQRVLVRHKLDSNLDPRTFTVGSFGFGNFTKEVKTRSPVLQDLLDYQPAHAMFVRITAGIDIVSNEVTWELETIDSKTGVAPEDPRKGFLPPNNQNRDQEIAANQNRDHAIAAKPE
ncbi:uncharacterized protein LOC116611783 isoform X3 [Nematostella vectensis]|uniref:uncharacterized protein LOC116611783 isoform X3 n=1 Tax=Nematostella vectensis TaxID=45351 RepID=UPI0020774CD8|nr:uncharacterized protein LOC116611783 isoform X3 [Nematostella vectensis]